jgi:hypothetical protein
MARDHGKDDDQNRSEEYTERLDPQGSHTDQSTNVAFTNFDEMEWCRFG